MKFIPTLIAGSLLLATTAFASEVTLYGVADVGVTVSKNKDSAAKVQMSNGNNLGNRFGFIGKEDLSNGNYVGFKLEQGFKLSNGNEHAEGKAFSREAQLNVGGNWGKFAAGRFGGLSSDCGSFSILGGSPYTTSFFTIGDLYSAFYLTDRYNNSLIYVSPTFSNFTASVMYSNGVEDDADKWSKNGHYYGIGLTYGGEALNADLIFEVLDNKGKKGSDGKNYKATKLLNLGGSYDFGAFKAYGAYELALNSPMPGVDWGFYEDGDKDEGIASVLASKGKGANFNAFSLGVSAPFQGGTAMLQTQYAFGKIKDKVNAEYTDSDKFSTFSIGAAYFYPLSKRTTVYANAGWGTAWKAARVVNDLQGWNATLGMTHTF